MTQNVHPYAPPEPLFRVKAPYRGFVAERFGVMYAHAELSRRDDGPEVPSYAPVALGPGDVRVFMWPSIELRREWLELVIEFDDPFQNVMSLQQQA